MGQGLIERRYGFGAGHVPLRPVPPRRRPLRGLREGFLEARREGDTPGTSLAEILRASPLFAAMAVALTLLFANILQHPPDESEIQIVSFAEPPPPALERPPEPEIPEPLPEEPAPAPPERAAPEPPRPLPPEPVARPAPEPPPRAPRPRAAKPPPQRPQIAQIQRLARAPEPPRPAAPRRAARDVRSVQESAPRLSLDPLSTPKPPEAPPPPAPTRAPRFAAARPPDAMPRLNAPALRPTPAAPARLRSQRVPAPAPDPSRRASPQLSLASAAPAPPSASPSPRRDARRAPALPPRREDRSPQSVSLELPAGAAPAPRPARRSSSANPRAERLAPAPGPAARSDEPGLRGVPLGSLAACVSDRLEDSLKQKVVARVRNRTHCESPTGRYHFVETKNVNAFLMRIERARGRRPGDRCAELTYALDCLSRR